MNLAALVSRSAELHPDRPAVSDGVTTFTYRELDESANRMARLLAELGVARGDRVGIWAEKSPMTVAAMQAVLRLGAAYVPIDPLSPTLRAEGILGDCSVRVLLTTRARIDVLSQTSRAPASESTQPAEGRTVAEVGHRSIALDELGAHLTSYASSPLALSDADDELAYILYTSGSTGKPKGVCISHRNALAFVEWAVRELRATEADRFANHAPFSFDLSVLDLYGAFSVGASVSIIPEGAGYAAEALVEFVKQARPTIWYSVPSALILMMDHAGLLDVPELPMRAVLFAGEPFPIKQVRRLRERWPTLRLLNLYGPTETNVCTFYEVHEVPATQTRPVPIGRACSGNAVWAARDDGSRAISGEEGILMVEGPTVMIGYWGHERHGTGPYAPGDVVRLNTDGEYEYLGRRDGMVKIRGFRIELGEVESILLSHAAIREAVALVVGAGTEAKLTAVLVAHDESRATLLELKRHCADRLPRYMIVDRVRWVDDLPRSENGKIDRKRIATTLERTSLEQ